MKRALRRWYYRADVPRGKAVKIGVWEQGTFVGAVVFGSGSTGDLGTRWGLNCFECCEMVRLALDPAHRTPTSRILSIAIKLLRKHSPGLRAVVTFADPGAGHIGTVYQAAGWMYLGRTTPRNRYIGPDGREYHDRAVSRSGWKVHQGKRCRCPKIDDCRAVRVPGKHRYVLPLDEAMRERLRPLAIAYPKKERAGSENSDTRTFQSERAGQH
jgi:hypothetical protein